MLVTAISEDQSRRAGAPQSSVSHADLIPVISCQPFCYYVFYIALTPEEQYSALVWVALYLDDDLPRMPQGGQTDFKSSDKGIGSCHTSRTRTPRKL